MITRMCERRLKKKVGKVNRYFVCRSSRKNSVLEKYKKKKNRNRQHKAVTYWKGRVGIGDTERLERESRNRNIEWELVGMGESEFVTQSGARVGKGVSESVAQSGKSLKRESRNR